MNIKKHFYNIFSYNPKQEYEFILPNSANNIVEQTPSTPQNIYPTLLVNIEYLKSKYNLLINSDVKIREFSIPIKNKQIPAGLLYIDGMVDEKTITNSVLQISQLAFIFDLFNLVVFILFYYN